MPSILYSTIALKRPLINVWNNFMAFGKYLTKNPAALKKIVFGQFLPASQPEWHRWATPHWQRLYKPNCFYNLKSWPQASPLTFQIFDFTRDLIIWAIATKSRQRKCFYSKRKRTGRRRQWGNRKDEKDKEQAWRNRNGLFFPRLTHSTTLTGIQVWSVWVAILLPFDAPILTIQLSDRSWYTDYMVGMVLSPEDFFKSLK